MKTILKFTVLFAILLAMSCQTESLDEATITNTEALDLTAKKSKKGKRVSKPISNSIEFAPIDDVFSAFNGTQTHFGKIHGTSETTGVIDNGDGTLTITGNDITYAANGDILYATSELLLTLPAEGTLATYTVSITITGGTGRFDGATGWLNANNGVIDLVTGIGSHAASGEITY
ncbi:hypothetical protein [Flavisericum labens]|uniref:hypothetical protein n=1 Tax=Flavisericum labens TaxID=3377112 RepID=UPI00387B0B45